MAETLALYGGTPVRSEKIYYGKQLIDEADKEAVGRVLRSDWLTQGPVVRQLEEKLAAFFGSEYAITCTSGTSALHLACMAAGIKDGDEVITSPLTFAASANCVRYCGGNVVFADISHDTYNIDPTSVEALITNKTKAIIAVDYAGQPAPLAELRELCSKYNLVLIEDAAHSLGSRYHNQFVGSIADLTTFSFHPVKTVTGGEGGAVLTNHSSFYETMQLAANQGITKNASKFEYADSFCGNWYCEQLILGYNYRMTELQAALILSQLNKLEKFIQRRREIVNTYNNAFSSLSGIIIPKETSNVDTCWHLYVIRVISEKAGFSRKEFFDALSAENVQPQVHYVPVHLHPYYRALGHHEGECPVAEKICGEVLSLPLYPAMTDSDVNDVIKAVIKVYEFFKDREAER